MSIWNRFRLLIGLVVVLLLVGVLFVYLDYSMSRVSATTAQLQADTYTVGTSYSGTVTQQYVHVGQKVKAGQNLFAIASDVFSSALASGQINKSGLSFTVDKNNNILLQANEAGTVTNIDYLQGAFVPANKEVATIAKVNSLYVQADYHLSPPDYNRVDNGSTVSVTLPNNQTVSAKVFYIAIVSNNNVATTLIKARMPTTASGEDTNFNEGTPVTAVLHLNGKTFFKSLNSTADRLFHGHGGN
jgi:multidrug resistance efflux pump